MKENLISGSVEQPTDTKQEFNLFKQILDFVTDVHDIAPWVIDVASAKVTLGGSQNVSEYFSEKTPCNESAFSIEETITTFHNIMKPDCVKVALENFYGIIEGRLNKYETVYELVDEQGQHRWISAKSSKIERNNKGDVVRILGMHRDVTQEYQQIAYLEDVFNSSDDIIFSTNLEQISRSNKQFSDVFHACLNVEQVLDSIKLFQINNKSLKNRSLNRVFIKNNCDKTVNVQVEYNQHMAYYALRIMKLNRSKGEYLLRLKKITDQIQYLSDLKKAESVFEHACEGITFTDAACNVISINKAFTKITGYQEDEIIGRNPRILKSDQQGCGFYRNMWEDIVSKGYFKGEICNRHKQGHNYYEILTITAIFNDAGVLTNYVGIFSDITLQKEQKEALEYLAHYDHLTGLANRSLLTQRLKRAIDGLKPFGVLYMDLDGFKAINDRFGHSAGDKLLAKLAKRFKSSIRESDTVARIGGDEFVIILNDISNYSHCIQAVERLLRQAAEPVYFKDNVLQVTASVGATFQYRDANHKLHIDTLLKQADCAMYNAKRTGKNCFKIFEPGMEALQQLDFSDQKLRAQLHDKVQNIKPELIETERRNSIRTKVLESLVKKVSLKDILLKIIEGVELDYPGMKCSILQVDEMGKTLGQGVAPSLPAFYSNAIDGVKIGLNIGCCSHAAATGKRIIVEDILTHPNWANFKGLAERAGLAACWSEPIIGSKGNVLGTFAIYHSKKSIPVKDDFKLIQMSAHLAALAIEKHQANKALWVSLNFDPLTKLPNKNLFTEHVKSAIIQHKNKSALLHLDINQFQRINHSFGYDFGDKLIIEMAKRLQRLLPKQAHMSRINGDEFVILTNGSLNAINQFTHGLARAIRQPFTLETETLHLEMSIGISLLKDTQVSVTEHFNNASKALLEHKTIGHGDYYHFDQRLQNKANKRIELEHDLRKAIDNDEFFLVYQPIFDLQENKLVKAEALIRWQHPVKGVIMPDEFIPLAEETKLIMAIGELVFIKAHTMVQHWRSNFSKDFKVSINTSVVQYQGSRALAETWINKHKALTNKKHGLIIELTESVLENDHQHMAFQLNELKKSGFEIALDDFGTGYSSLAYLQKFRFDYLKIDRSFISHTEMTKDNIVLCETIVLMAKKLGIQVIAEGVETSCQLDFLRQINAEFAQGFHFSKPVRQETFEQLFFES